MAADGPLPDVGHERGNQEQGHRARQVDRHRQDGEADRREAQADDPLDRTREQEGPGDYEDGAGIEHRVLSLAAFAGLPVVLRFIRRATVPPLQYHTAGAAALLLRGYDFRGYDSPQHEVHAWKDRRKRKAQPLAEP